MFKRETGKHLTAIEIFESQEKAARKLVEQVHDKLALTISNLLFVFNPEGVVLGGSISNAIDMKLLRKKIKTHGHPSLTKEAKILKHELGPAAGVLGAAFLAIR